MLQENRFLVWFTQECLAIAEGYLFWIQEEKLVARGGVRVTFCFECMPWVCKSLSTAHVFTCGTSGFNDVHASDNAHALTC